jgi:hypothetical protein
MEGEEEANQAGELSGGLSGPAPRAEERFFLSAPATGERRGCLGRAANCWDWDLGGGSPNERCAMRDEQSAGAETQSTRRVVRCQECR